MWGREAGVPCCACLRVMLCELAVLFTVRAVRVMLCELPVLLLCVLCALCMLCVCAVRAAS